MTAQTTKRPATRTPTALTRRNGALRITLLIRGFMSEPPSQPPSENSLAFGGAFAGLQTLFGCRSSRFRIGKFALGLALRVLRILGLRLCLFRFFACSSSFFLRSF